MTFPSQAAGMTLVFDALVLFEAKAVQDAFAHVLHDAPVAFQLKIKPLKVTLYSAIVAL